MMLRITLVTILCLGFTGSAWAVFDNYGSSARVLSLGDASAASADEPSIMQINPGALGFLPQNGIQTSHSRLYDLDELSEGEVYVAFLLHRFTLGAGSYAFGKRDYYKEGILNLAFAYRILDRLSFGSNLKSMRVSFSPKYYVLSRFSMDVGSAYQVNDKLYLGFAARNINHPHLVKNSDDIPANYRLGLTVFPFPDVSLLLDLTYEDRYKEQFHLGQEIKLLKNLALRFGIQTAPARYAFGIGLNWAGFVLDYAYLNHSILGNTHKISFSYGWGRRGSK
jgi:hypothetical protein